jgi:hypothetical protein
LSNSIETIKFLVNNKNDDLNSLLDDDEGENNELIPIIGKLANFNKPINQIY